VVTPDLHGGDKKLPHTRIGLRIGQLIDRRSLRNSHVIQTSQCADDEAAEQNAHDGYTGDVEEKFEVGIIGKPLQRG